MSITPVEITEHFKAKRDAMIWEITAISEPIDHTLFDSYAKDAEYYWVTCVTNDPTFSERIHGLVPNMPPQYNNILMYKKYPDGFKQIGLKYAA